jgi:ribosome-binding protein aMBF1 (putative translation factor)
MNTITSQSRTHNGNHNVDTIMRPVQCRMARTALGWGVRELATAAKVSPDTVARFERGGALRERTVEDIQKSLEAAGVRFTEDGCVCPPD